jgi:3-oxoacyl-[acyl-carrier-protein] synthase II
MGTGPARKVAVTGIGMITPLGTSLAECWANLLQGRSGITRIPRLEESSCRTTIGGSLPEKFHEMEEAEFPKRLRLQTLPVTRMAFLCAKEALADSGIEVGSVDPYRFGVISGSGQVASQVDRENAGPLKYMVLKQMVNAIPAWISIKNKLKGPAYNVATACSSGAMAVGIARDYISSGRGDAAIALGADMMLTPETVMSFNELLALSERNEVPEEASCPFDERRDGFVLSDGGCAMILEDLDTALKRNARVYALVSGVGISSEAYNIVAPEPTGSEMAKTMSLAINDAGVSAESIGYISAHGTSTRHNDAKESLAIKNVFGPHAYKLAVSSQKSLIGHTIGAAGAIEAAVCALSLHHGTLTPTINYREPDPECDLDYVPLQPREVEGLKAALTNSFAFGGHNCSILFERHG